MSYSITSRFKGYISKIYLDKIYNILNEILCLYAGQNSSYLIWRLYF